jgi:hypothetical protein
VTLNRSERSSGLSEGKTQEQIASEQGISTKTVQRRLEGIKKKARRGNGKITAKAAVDSCPLPGTITDICASSEVAA